jgi:hypothetical protein
VVLSTYDDNIWAIISRYIDTYSLDVRRHPQVAGLYIRCHTRNKIHVLRSHHMFGCRKNVVASYLHHHPQINRHSRSTKLEGEKSDNLRRKAKAWQTNSHRICPEHTMYILHAYLNFALQMSKDPYH